jgi:hypothetical protein
MLEGMVLPQGVRNGLASTGADLVPLEGQELEDIVGAQHLGDGFGTTTTNTVPAQTQPSDAALPTITTTARVESVHEELHLVIPDKLVHTYDLVTAVAVVVTIIFSTQNGRNKFLISDCTHGFHSPLRTCTMTALAAEE